MCKKQFKTKPPKDNKFCSLGCYWKSMKISNELLKFHQKENTRKYRKAHPEWCAEVKHKRRALVAEVGGHFTAKDWIEIKERQNQKCNDCGERKKLTVDHKIPLNKWKEWIKNNLVSYRWNDKENIQGLCGSCNSKKWVKI